jgi:hypothetical protein
MPTIIVSLNGTETNPFNKLGLTQNPFGQVNKGETDEAERRLNSLGAEPIPSENSEAYIREKLAGFSPEFVDLCVNNYRPGKMIKFKVKWSNANKKD